MQREPTQSLALIRGRVLVGLIRSFLFSLILVFLLHDVVKQQQSSKRGTFHMLLYAPCNHAGKPSLQDLADTACAMHGGDPIFCVQDVVQGGGSGNPAQATQRAPRLQMMTRRHLSRACPCTGSENLQ